MKVKGGIVRYVALLRGINVGGHRQVPMAMLREVAEAAGLEDVRTYVASGNLAFSSDEAAEGLEAKLEGAIEKGFGFQVDVLVRSKTQWDGYVRGNPMPERGEEQAKLLMMTLGKRPATDADVEGLRAKASGNERVERAGEAIWIWFGDGAGRSKIGTGPRGKEIWTTRNWRTVLKLQDMLSE